MEKNVWGITTNKFQKVSSIIKSNYIANENVSLVINKDQVNQNINDKKFQLIDARGEKRFKGLEPEPRKECPKTIQQPTLEPV